MRLLVIDGEGNLCSWHHTPIVIIDPKYFKVLHQPVISNFQLNKYGIVLFEKRKRAKKQEMGIVCASD